MLLLRLGLTPIQPQLAMTRSTSGGGPFLAARLHCAVSIKLRGNPKPADVHPNLLGGLGDPRRRLMHVRLNVRLKTRTCVEVLADAQHSDVNDHA